MAALNVLQISDLHILDTPGDTMLGVNTEYYFQQTLARAFAIHGHFDLILVTGDLTQEPSSSSYRRIASHLADYKTPCLCLPGNHDDPTLMAAHLNNAWVKYDQQIRLGSWRFVLLNSRVDDSPAGRLSKNDLIWLEALLEKQTDDFFVVAVHHHAYLSGCAWLDRIGIENGQQLLDLLERYDNVKALVNGHIHQDLKRHHQHITMLSAPSTCFQFATNSADFMIDDLPPGYRVLNLFDDGSLTGDCYRLPEKLNGLDLKNKGY